MEKFIVLANFSNQSDHWRVYTSSYETMEEFLEKMKQLGAHNELDMNLPFRLFEKKTVTGWHCISTKNSLLWINQKDLNVQITDLPKDRKDRND